MNPQGFISLKIGQKILFQHPLSQLTQLSLSVNKKKFNSKNYKRIDVVPKFFANQHMKEMNKNLSIKLMNKKEIFNKIKSTYFSKVHPSFSEKIKNIEKEIKFIDESLENKKNNKKFEGMLGVLNDHRQNEKLNIKSYKNINNEMKNEILNSISLKKQIFSQKLGLNKSLNSKNHNTNSSKYINPINENNDDFINNNNIEKNINSNKNLNKIIPITDEKIELFKIFIGNTTLSNNIVLSYFDKVRPNVKFAAEKYFQSKYGSGYINLNFSYPTNPPGNKLHKFKFISEIQELFFIAQNDLGSNVSPRLFIGNGKEIINNRRIKCIGALNLINNSIIKVLKQ